MFLVIRYTKVIDTPAVEEVPAELDGDGNLITPAVPAVAEVSHEEVDDVRVETSGDAVAQILTSSNRRLQGLVDVYEINIPEDRSTRPRLNRVRKKAGPRTRVPVKEIQEIEADGRVVGKTEIDV